MNKKMIADIYPLSPMQEGMLYHYLVDDDVEQYFEQTCFEIQGNLELDYFQQAWDWVITDNEVLRTVFRWEGVKTPLQIVLSERKPNITILNLSNLSPGEQQRQLEKIKLNDRKKGFDLKTGPLNRLLICYLSQDHYAIIWSYHHIIMDGWSTGIILTEVFQAYRGLLQGESITPIPKCKFKNYLKFMESQDQEKVLQYWREYLAGFTIPTGLPGDQNSQKKSTLSEVELNIELQESIAIKEFAKRNRVTVNTILQFAWAIILQRYNRCRDVVYGSTVSGRPETLPGIQHSVGLYINTVPVRFKFHPEETIISQLRRQMEMNLQQKSYEYLSLTEIAQQSELPGQIPLFDNILVFENYPINQTINALDINLKIINITAHELTNYNLAITTIIGETLKIKFTYNPNQYQPKLIQQVTKQLGHILYEIFRYPEKKIGDLDLLTDTEKKELLKISKGPRMEVPEKCIHHLIEEQVVVRPEAIAVIADQDSLTYAELNTRANYFAGILNNYIGNADSIIPIMVERSLEMVIGLLAILKAGGTYLPLDPIYPENRIKFMLVDSGAQLLIIGKAQQNLVPKEFAGKILILEELLEQSSTAVNSHFVPTNLSTADSLAYVIYTSGSTGKPKGIMIKHRSVVNFVLDLTKKLPLTSGQTLLALTTICFDISVLEIFLTLASGLQVVIASSAAQHDPEILQELLVTTKTEIIQMTPSSLQMLLSSGKLPNSLKVILLGGEPLPHSLLVELQSQTSARIYNMYGPTETTIWSLYQELTTAQKVYLGQPIANTRVYVLDIEGRLAPSGMIGEIFIAGIGLARGYLHREDLTHERFVPDPFLPGELMYRTGDLGCRHADGHLTFHGRVDHQVKIRGFRIELEEIEAVLNDHPDIRQSVINLYQDSGGDSQLIGYLVLNNQYSRNPEEEELQSGLSQRNRYDIRGLREYLLSLLPDYMVPGNFIILDHLPVTPNGKIDRQALPTPDEQIQINTRYVPPRNETERLLTEIWSEVLEKEKIGIYDNFFELGGHSLKLTRIISRIHKVLDIKIPASLFFETPTIAGIVDGLQLIKKGNYREIFSQPHQDYYPTSHAQRRLWIIDRLEGEVTSYNMPAAYRIKGNLNFAALQQAFQTLTQRHEILRTGFKLVDDEPVQYVVEDLPVQINYLNSVVDEAVILEQEARKAFDLRQPGQLRMNLFKLNSDEYLLLITIHHIIFDEWSRNIFISELAVLYNTFVTQKPNTLQPLRVQYKDYAVWQNELLESQEMVISEQYWLAKLQGDLPVLDLPTDKPRPRLRSTEGDLLKFHVEQEMVRELKRFAQKQNVTLFMVLLTAYYILLYRYSQQNDLIIGIPTTNRQNEDLEKMIGFFVNTLPVRLQLDVKESIFESLNRIKEASIQAIAHQEYPLDKLLERLNTNWDTSRSIFFDTMFNYTDIDVDANFKLEGLQVIPLEQNSRTAKNDLTINLTLADQGLSGSIEYCTDLFETETIRQMSQHYMNLLEKIIHNSEETIDCLDFLSSTECSLIAKGWKLAEIESPLREELIVPPTLVGYDNLKVYLLDSSGRPVPIGAVGQVYLGNLSSPKIFLTEQTKLIEHPLSPGNFLYNTNITAKVYSNGQLNSLQIPEEVLTDSQNNSIRSAAPRTDFEKKLVNIWRDVLQIKQVGIYDNFFDLGGTSLMLIPLFERIRQITDIPLTIGDLLIYHTISMFSTYVESQKFSTEVAVTKKENLFELILNDKISSEEAIKIVFGDNG